MSVFKKVVIFFTKPRGCIGKVKEERNQRENTIIELEQTVVTNGDFYLTYLKGKRKEERKGKIIPLKRKHG